LPPVGGCNDSPVHGGGFTASSARRTKGGGP
jgi:hypothetical protein